MWFVTWGGRAAPPAPSVAALALGCRGQRLGHVSPPSLGVGAVRWGEQTSPSCPEAPMRETSEPQ